MHTAISKRHRSKAVNRWWGAATFRNGRLLEGELASNSVRRPPKVEPLSVGT